MTTFGFAVITIFVGAFLYFPFRFAVREYCGGTIPPLPEGNEINTFAERANLVDGLCKGLGLCMMIGGLIVSLANIHNL